MVAKKSAHDVRRASLGASLEGAARTCDALGVRLTDKRRRLLESLITAPGPLSAYDLAQVYRKDHGEEIPVMTVYRMLDAFIEAGLVHKLRSTNRYVSCRHMACDHPHAASQFLICDGCGQVKEMDLANAELNRLSNRARSSGFHLHREQLELHGLCDRCHEGSGERSTGPN
jgi:Fur family zinc uptake transcriptional regulator